MSVQNIFLLFSTFIFVNVRCQVCVNSVEYKNSSYIRTINYNMSAESVSESLFKREIFECCPGYHLLNSSLPVKKCNCVRDCNACEHGTCDQKKKLCICLESYERYPPNSNTCVPKCAPGLVRVNGTCKQLNCYPKCGHGTCFEGNICQCWHRYESKSNSSTRCVPKCNNCKGDCIAPGVCRCKKPLLEKYFTADGDDCDCFEDCASKCFGNICVHPDAIEDDETSYQTEADQLHNTNVVGAELSADIPTDKELALSKYLYTSVVVNIVVAFILGLMIYKNPGILRCCRRDNGTSTANVSNNHQYEYISEDAKNILVLNKYPHRCCYTQNIADISEESNTEPLRYDYVQLPLPINQRF